MSAAHNYKCLPRQCCDYIGSFPANYWFSRVLVTLIISSTVGGAVSASSIWPVHGHRVDSTLTVGWKGEDDNLYQCYIKP